MATADREDVQDEPVAEPGGSAALQISNAIGRIHKQLVGRGPDGVRTHIADDLVVCLLEGGFTRAEQTVRENGGARHVLQLRLQLQEAMRPAIVEAVETVTGRRVRSFMSANDPAHNLQAEVLTLESRAPGG